MFSVNVRFHPHGSCLARRTPPSVYTPTGVTYGNLERGESDGAISSSIGRASDAQRGGDDGAPFLGDRGRAHEEGAELDAGGDGWGGADSL